MLTDLLQLRTLLVLRFSGLPTRTGVCFFSDKNTPTSNDNGYI